MPRIGILVVAYNAESTFAESAPPDTRRRCTRRSKKSSCSTMPARSGTYQMGRALMRNRQRRREVKIFPQSRQSDVRR